MPNTAKVELNLEGAAEPLPMTKGPDGVWSTTVSGLVPQYGYTFEVDGTDILDPHNVNFKTSLLSAQNFFLVPGQPPRLSEPTNVPRGVVHHHYYRSSIVGINSEFYVHTPPHFDPSGKQPYPVLFLLHRGGSDPSTWTVMGKVNVILDNLIGQRKARPMIVVMPLGFGTMDVITRGGSAWDDPELVHRDLTRFSDVLFHEVMPLVKQQYPVSAKREDHALAGLSMGGTESLLVGLKSPR